MGVQWEIDFDYNEFEKQLYDASLKAFTTVQDDHKDETFYGFALNSSALLGYMGMSANTEEGLTRVALKYKESFYLERNQSIDLPLEMIRLELRISVGDYAYFAKQKYNQYFDESVNELLSEHSRKMDELEENNLNYLDEEEDEEELQEIYFSSHDKLFDVIIKVLRELDSLRIFEKTNERNNINLRLFPGLTSDEEMFYYTSLTNPPEVYESFIQEVKQSRRISEEIKQLRRNRQN